MNIALTYNRLIDDHDAIEVAASMILGDLKQSRPDSGHLASSLSRLGVMVRDHIHNEDIVLASLSQTHLDAVELQGWIVAADDFERLRFDWLAFLDHWSLAAIDQRRAEFAAAARLILKRLNARVRFESETFYAAALQSGAIERR
jgi:hypothetical protein